MKHNSYFEGKVQSLAVATPDGPATVGVIEPGKYSFGTDCEEHMHVVAGTLKAKLPGGEWKSFGQGQINSDCGCYATGRGIRYNCGTESSPGAPEAEPWLMLPIIFREI